MNKTITGLILFFSIFLASCEIENIEMDDLFEINLKVEKWDAGIIYYKVYGFTISEELLIKECMKEIEIKRMSRRKKEKLVNAYLKTSIG